MNHTYTPHSGSHSSGGSTFKAFSSDATLQYVLADIPFFAVGMFALGVFTFRMVLRRYKWLTICLLLSAFMAFAASILDLVQILGRDGRASSAVANTHPFLEIIISREIAYALSFGLRYLWLWGFVACPPPASAPQDRRMHSGSWARWGLVGTILCWLLVPAPLAITSLQILYRIYTPFSQFGPIYEAECTLQITLSAIFILKLLLNVYVVALDQPGSASSGRTFLCYLPILLALLINLGIGIGNIFVFLFSETVLGRFSQGVELYVIILYTLVATFYHLRDVSEKSSFETRRKRSSSFQSPAALDSGYLLPAHRLSAADLVSAFQRQAEGQNRDGTKAVRRESSYTSRMSTWLGSRRPSLRLGPSFFPPPEKSEAQMQDLERGISPLDTDVKIVLPSRDSFAEKPSQYTMGEGQERSSVAPTTTKSILSTTTSVTLLAVPRRARIRFSDLDSKSQAPVTPSSDLPTPTPSPIYGSDGGINANRVAALTREDEEDEEDPREYFANSARSSGISGLIRQQEELDKSIAALKLFSTPSEDGTSRRVSQETEADRAASPKSEFSLSNFPQPPWKRSSGESSKSKRTVSGGPEEPSSRSPLIDPLAPPPSAYPAGAYRSRLQSIPSSDTGELPVARNRISSVGTQYEITSFIGHLTQPGYKNHGNLSIAVSDPSLSASSSLRRGRSLKAIEESPLSPEGDSLLDPPRTQRTGPVPESPLRAFRELMSSPSDGSQRRPFGLPPNPRVMSPSR